MEEIYESDFYNVLFDKKYNAVILTWLKCEESEAFRTSVMHAADIVRKHNDAILVVDRTSEPTVTADDRKWVRKNVIPAFKRAGLKRIIFISPRYDESSEVAEESDHIKRAVYEEYPDALFAYEFRVDRYKTADEVYELLGRDIKLDASEEVSGMTKAQALEYMGLKPDANDFLIDEKYWQLSKRYRSEEGDNGQKLADLTAAYDIATGRRDSREEALKIRENSKKFLGKTGAEWKNHFAYTWYLYILGIVLIIAGCNLFYNIFIKPRYDCGIVSIGHFDITDDTYFDTILTDRLDFDNPYISYVNVVVPNDQGETGTAYEDQSATTALLTRPNIIVTDSHTAPYYYDQLVDLSDLYIRLAGILSASDYAKITPVYCSENQFHHLSDNYVEGLFIGEEGDSDENNYSTKQVMIGLMIEEADIIEQMGYDTLWDDAPNLVFCIYNDSRSYSDSVDILVEILSTL